MLGQEDIIDEDTELVTSEVKHLSSWLHHVRNLWKLGVPADYCLLSFFPHAGAVQGTEGGGEGEEKEEEKQ